MLSKLTLAKRVLRLKRTIQQDVRAFVPDTIAITQDRSTRHVTGRAGNGDMKLDQITEAWSKKYKRSIDCNNPKGFSQKAHCDSRQKNEDIAGVPLPKNYNPNSDTYGGSANRIPNSKSINKSDITATGKRTEFPDSSYDPDMLAGINKQQTEKLINAALSVLSKREEMLLRARFGITPFTQSFTLRQVGNAMGIGPERVRQLEARALRKLKHPKVSRTLRGLLDENERQLPIDMNRIRQLIQRLESQRYITPQEADEMRRAIQALASGRDTILPARILQLLNMVS